MSSDSSLEKIAKTVEVASLSSFFAELAKLDKQPDTSAFFRGHPLTSYKLEPSVFRTSAHRENEDKLLLSFMAESPREFLDDKFAFDKLVRAQHYGIKTRLLDLTSNPLIALYFTCAEHQGFDGEVVRLEAPSKRVKFFSSDVVSCLSNLCFLSSDQKKKVQDHFRHVLSKTSGFREITLAAKAVDRDSRSAEWKKIVERFNDNDTVRRLVHFIREEKAYFEEKIDPLDLYSYVVVTPKKNNSRIAAQSGSFIIFGMSQRLADLPEGFPRTNMVVKSVNKGRILEELETIGINEFFVYPELDRIAKAISVRFGVKT